MALPLPQATYFAPTAALTTSAGLATTFTGLVLANPVNSPVSIILTQFTFAPLVAQTAALILGLQIGYNLTTNVTLTSAVVPVSNVAGSPRGYGVAATSATLPTAAVLGLLVDSLPTGALTTQLEAGQMFEPSINIYLPPGGYVATYTSVASVASSLAFGFTWIEG